VRDVCECVQAIGGNVANASPISDLNPVLMACKAIFTLIKVDGSTREIAAKEVPYSSSSSSSSSHY